MHRECHTCINTEDMQNAGRSCMDERQVVGRLILIQRKYHTQERVLVGAAIFFGCRFQDSATENRFALHDGRARPGGHSC